MSNIPQNSILRSSEHVMKSHSQLNHTKARPQMTPGFRHVEDDIGPELVGELLQFLTSKDSNFSEKRASDEESNTVLEG